MKKTIIIVSTILLLGIIGGLIFNHYKKEKVFDTLTQNNVEKTVKDFGSQLQKVSLLSPVDILKSDIEADYGPYISSELLNQWLADPQSAPGRTVSSPWPDHIEIDSVEHSGEEYSVKGDIILMTSNEVEHGGEAGRQSISLVLKNIDGKLLITNCTVGSLAI